MIISTLFGEEQCIVTPAYKTFSYFGFGCSHIYRGNTMMALWQRLERWRKTGSIRNHVELYILNTGHAIPQYRVLYNIRISIHVYGNYWYWYWSISVVSRLSLSMPLCFSSSSPGQGTSTDTSIASQVSWGITRGLGMRVNPLSPVKHDCNFNQFSYAGYIIHSLAKM